MANPPSRRSIHKSLTRPLPAGMPNAEKLAILRERVKTAQTLANSPRPLPPKMITAALAARGKIGVSFSDRRISDVMRIAEGKKPYNGVAKALVKIWKWQRDSRNEMLLEDHRILTQIANKLRKAERPSSKKSPLPLTTREKKVLKFYLLRLDKSGKNPEFELSGD
jgi:hypothetical protein